MYLLSYFFEVGPLMSGGMGDSPLTNGELLAWQENTGIFLQPWEARFLSRLSRDYLIQSQKSEKADCPAPYLPRQIQDREIIAQKVQHALRSRIT